jgi:hypothetical protein
MPTCGICDTPIRLRGDEFYGAHIACAKGAVYHCATHVAALGTESGYVIVDVHAGYFHVKESTGE